MTLQKEKWSDDNWQAVNVPPRKKPDYYYSWLGDYCIIDRNNKILFIPATTSYDSRDGYERFLLILFEKSIWVNTEHKEGKKQISWSLWEGATENDIENVNCIIEESFSLFYEKDLQSIRSSTYFYVENPFRQKSTEELVENMNLNFNLASSVAILRYPRYNSLRIIDSFNYINVRKKFVHDHVKRFFDCLNERERGVVIQQYMIGKASGLEADVLKLLKKIIVHPV